MNNLLNLTIKSLIATYPLYNKEDILILDSISEYADPEVFRLLNKFHYSVMHMEGEGSITFLQQALSILESESTNRESTQSPVQSFNYTVTDGYIPQPLSGNIEANNLTHAYEIVCDIYASELSVSESDLQITIR